MDQPVFTIDAVRDLAEQLEPWIVRTPVVTVQSDVLDRRLGASTPVSLKLELFQRTGSFKPRGALAVMLDLGPEELARGITAVSAGNHAIAAAYAARCLGTTAKVVMLPTANPARIARCRAFGAEVEIARDGTEAFARATMLAEVEGRTLVHPFEGPRTTLGTATIGLEWDEQAGDLDALIIPIGGGGLCSGLATAIRMLRPGCAIYGVEPAGAANMSRSFAAGHPVATEHVETIADSLGPPYSLPYSFGLCRRALDDIVLVSDDEIRIAVSLMFDEARLAVEPAAAAGLAALLGPLRPRLAGKRVGLIACGTNIDLTTYHGHAERGRQIAVDAA